MRRWRLQIVVISATFALVNSCVTPAWPVGLETLDDATLERLATDLDAGRQAQALVETQRSLIATFEQTIAALQEALDRGKAEAAATREALIRADERDKLRAESIGLLKDALAEYRTAMKEAREEATALRKQASTDRILSAIPILGAFLIFFGLGR